MLPHQKMETFRNLIYRDFYAKPEFLMTSFSSWKSEHSDDGALLCIGFIYIDKNVRGRKPLFIRLWRVVLYAVNGYNPE